MIRRMSSLLGVCLLGVTAAQAGQGKGVAGPAISQDVLVRDIGAMSGRLSTRNPDQAVADAQRIAMAYRSMGPLAGAYSAADYRMNQQLARLSLDWLSRASVVYANQPLVMQAFLSSYDSIGRFYQDYGAWYRPGAFVAYASATRLAQRMALASARDAALYERELERYAYAYGSIAVANGWLLGPWSSVADLPDTVSAAPPPPVIKPVELPPVDTASLSAEDRAAYTEVRDKFRSVSSKVHQSRLLLGDLSSRLQARRMTLNPTDAADALKMQGYVEDAAQLIGEKQFEQASLALTRADYVRTRLRGTTGQ